MQIIAELPKPFTRIWVDDLADMRRIRVEPARSLEKVRELFRSPELTLKCASHEALVFLSEIDLIVDWEDVYIDETQRTFVPGREPHELLMNWCRERFRRGWVNLGWTWFFRDDADSGQFREAWASRTD